MSYRHFLVKKVLSNSYRVIPRRGTHSPTSKRGAKPSPAHCRKSVERGFRACETSETSEGQRAQRSIFAQSRIFCWVSPIANAYAEDELETTWRVEEPEEEVEKETPLLPS